ncbi:MAG: hypothetical protein KGH57_04225 [Candidatus Micrarchaeota archaeon]|nr:hypothetical protein [Candidatus Micrarchaeota archaeon]
MDQVRTIQTPDGALENVAREGRFSRVEKAIASVTTASGLVFAGAKIAATRLTQEVTLGFGYGSMKLSNLIVTLGGIGWNGPTGDSYASLNLALQGTTPRACEAALSAPTASTCQIVNMATAGNNIWTSLGLPSKIVSGDSVVYLKEAQAHSVTLVMQNKVVPLLGQIATSAEGLIILSVAALGAAILTKELRNRESQPKAKRE